MISADSHVHTEFSPDCNIPMEAMVKRAADIGLSELVITDHYDYFYETTSEFYMDIQGYIRSFNKIKAIYADKICLHLGLELGIIPTAATEIRSLISSSPFEFIIGSTHEPSSGSYCYGTFFEGKTKQQAYTEYFEQTLSNILSTDLFDVYGHLDYIPRYGIYDDNSLHYRDYADIIDEILKTLISAGKGLEVNTSGYRYGLDSVHPQVEILKRYHDLGGEIVTVGSDAHQSRHIGADFDCAEAALKASGFTGYTIFKNRKPIWKSFGI